MKDLVLIDSSVWIEVVRSGGHAGMIARVEGLISSGSAAMTEPIWMELYQGIRSKREEARLEMTRSLCTWLAFDAACWQEAARTARACLRSGANVPFGDVLVHACSVRHGVELLEKDRHFAIIAEALQQ